VVVSRQPLSDSSPAQPSQERDSIRYDTDRAHGYAAGRTRRRGAKCEARGWTLLGGCRQDHVGIVQQLVLVRRRAACMRHRASGNHVGLDRRGRRGRRTTGAVGTVGGTIDCCMSCHVMARRRRREGGEEKVPALPGEREAEGEVEVEAEVEGSLVWLGTRLAYPRPSSPIVAIPAAHASDAILAVHTAMPFMPSMPSTRQRPYRLARCDAPVSSSHGCRFGPRRHPPMPRRSPNHEPVPN
jgi:hypothetical protein